MKKFLLVFLVLAIAALNASTYAQKGNNSLGIGPDLSLPLSAFGSQFNPGFGAYAKGMLGVGTAGQVTFTIGYSSFKEQGHFDDFNTTMSIVPLVLGYRHNFNGFFVEPSLGYGLYGAKVNWADGETDSGSEAA